MGILYLDILSRNFTQSCCSSALCVHILPKKARILSETYGADFSLVEIEEKQTRKVEQSSTCAAPLQG